MGKYKTVVMDPPWRVGSEPAKPGKKTAIHGPIGLDKRIGTHGKTMPYKMTSDAEIKKFLINDFAADNSLLFLWTIHGKLPFAIKTCEDWGFTYHAVITWDKHSGLGLNGIYRNTELAVFAYRGTELAVFAYRGKMFKNHRNPFRLLVSEKARENSRKPDKFYRMLAKSTPEPRVDIFARYRHYGFDAWGDQVQDGGPSVLC